MDPQYCSGENDRGTQCRCRRFIEQPGTFQCTCAHLEGFHPDATLVAAPILPPAAPPPAVPKPSISPSDIISQYYNPSQILTQKAGTQASTSTFLTSTIPPIPSSSKIPPPASSSFVSVAVQETNHGLKRKQPDDDSGISAPLRKKSKKKQVPGTVIKIGGIIFIVTQAGDPDRQVFFTPKPPVIALLETRGLAVNNLKTELSINTGFTAGDVDTFLRGLFVSLFLYLDKHFPLKAGEFHWQFLIRNNATLSVSPHSPADGAEMSRYFGTARPQQRRIFLATRHVIPSEVWDNQTGKWDYDVAPDVEMSEGEDDLFSMEESEAEEPWVNPDDTPPKSKKALGKQRAKSVSETGSLSPDPAISISNSDSEEAEFEPPFTQATTSALPTLDLPQRPIRSTRSIATMPRLAPYSAYAYCSAKNFVAWDEEDLPLDDQFWYSP
ncbi:hypothetical protein R3P38DRAFT_2782799 [Favolaschia claudopus]|uniref:Uncharacterized protein n=1 Tax=Favolaschia claudopus TaxID=2862362 RepID=A0AAW0B1J4_9AGAR